MSNRAVFELVPLPSATRIFTYSQSWETTTSRLFRKSFSAGFFCDSVRQRSSFRSCEFPESSERGESVDSFYLTEQSPKSCCCSRENSAQRAELVEQENPSIQTGFIGQSMERRRLCTVKTGVMFYRDITVQLQLDNMELRSNIRVALWWLVVVQLFKKNYLQTKN